MKTLVTVVETKPKNDEGEYTINIKGRVNFGEGMYQNMSIWAKTTKPRKKGLKLYVEDLTWEWSEYVDDNGTDCRVRRMTGGIFSKVADK